jgi:hypothetical protein
LRFSFNNHNCPELIPKRLHPSNYGLRHECRAHKVMEYEKKNHGQKKKKKIMALASKVTETKWRQL